MVFKYLKGETVTISRSENKPLSAPALTFCIKNQLKNLTSYGEMNRGFSDTCNTSSVKELNECFDRYTYNHTEIVEDVLLGRNRSFLGLNYWTSYFQAKSMGRCHTLQIPNLLNGSGAENSIIINFNAQNDLTYITIVHDPKFFLTALNPLTFSRFCIVQNKLLSTKKNGTGEKFFLSVHHHVKREYDPKGNKKCDPDPNYNFMICVQNFGARTVGCHPSWDNFFNDYPNCTTIDQIKQHEELYEFYYFEDKNRIQEKTGCLEPCDFFEYRFVGEIMAYTHADAKLFKMSLSLVSSSYELLVEELGYPFPSFLGEFGGALGLFLGASFLSIWDFVEFLTLKIKKIAGN